MRPRGSITGPLILIALGFFFLIHAIQPEFPVSHIIARYWPYLLIVWGFLALLEVSFRSILGRPIPVNGISGGGWFAVVLICLAGLTLFQIDRPNAWWHGTDWSRGFDTAFGEEHSYPIPGENKATGSKPHIVLEDFRGVVKITGNDGSSVTVDGEKRVRAMKTSAADQTNIRTPVELIERGNDLIVRCNQNAAIANTVVSTNLNISVPRGASLDASGSGDDFSASSLTGNVNIQSNNSAVRLEDIGGNASIETHRSDLLRCVNVRGSLDIHGHGSDVELTKVAGQVTINGNYTGTLSLHDLSGPVHVRNVRMEIQAQQIPGELKLDRGSLDGQGLVGPIRVVAHSTDITLRNCSNEMELSVDRGDVELTPVHLPLGKMTVHSGSGNIELTLPTSATFALAASTGHGEVENEFGDALKEQTTGRGARLDGSLGSGPEVTLTTGRGSVTVRKSSDTATTAAALAN